MTDLQPKPKTSQMRRMNDEPGDNLSYGSGENADTGAETISEGSRNLIRMDPPADKGGTELMLIVPPPPDQHPAAVYLARLGAGSRRTMATSLDLIAGLLTSYRCNMRTLDWSSLRYQHTAAVRAILQDLYAPTTANKMLAALRGVLRTAWRLGQMSAEEYQRAADLQAIRGQTVPRGRELKGGEIAALMSACANDPSTAGARDAAIIALMYSTGLRREEVVTLNSSDYDAADGRLLVRGKGNKERTVYARGGASEAAADWLRVRGPHAGPLFWPVNKGGKPTSRRMTTQAIYNMLKKRAAQAAIKEFSPHDLRRTFVSHLLEAKADIVTVSKLAGHANIQTTARYDRRPEEAKRQALDLLHVPYFERRNSET